MTPRPPVSIVVTGQGAGNGAVEVALAAGARVVEGTWGDDFAAARNAGLEHCRGRWIVWIDADEELTGDPSVLRQLLAASTADAHTVEIRNLGDDGEVAMAFFSTRVFRRGRARFVGRIHEVPRSVDPRRPLEVEPTDVVAVRHHGDTTVVGRAGADEGAARERVLAAAVAHRLFGDRRAVPVLVRGAQVVPDADLAGLAAEVALLAPDLVEPFVMAAGATDHRLELIAAAMEQLGDRDAADRARARRTDAA